MIGIRIGAITLALGLVIANVATAQRRTLIGPIGGVNLSSFGGAGAEGSSSKVGVAAGVFATLGARSGLTFETGALFSQRGGKVLVDDGPTSITFKIGYLEIPALAVYRFAGKSSLTPFIGAGAALGIRVSCSVSGTDGTTTISVDCGALADGGDVFKSTDFGLVGQAGVEVDNFRILARYNLGLSTIDTSLDPSIKNRTLSLLVGYGFRIGR